MVGFGRSFQKLGFSVFDLSVAKHRDDRSGRPTVYGRVVEENESAQLDAAYIKHSASKVDRITIGVLPRGRGYGYVIY
jgi:hypothetical protein